MESEVAEKRPRKRHYCKIMWKILCFVALVVVSVAGGKIVPGKLIGPMTDDPNSELALFGSFFINKFAKIAREIVHNSSK